MILGIFADLGRPSVVQGTTAKDEQTMSKYQGINHAFQIPGNTTKVSNWVYWAFLLACIGLVIAATQFAIEQDMKFQRPPPEFPTLSRHAFSRDWSLVIIFGIFTLAVSVRSGASVWVLWVFWIREELPKVFSSYYGEYIRNLDLTMIAWFLGPVSVITLLLIYLIRHGEIRRP